MTTLTIEMMRKAVEMLSRPPRVEPLCMLPSEYAVIRTEWDDAQIESYARAAGFDGFLVYNLDPFKTPEKP